jgi:hypothetical protein
MLKQEQSNAKDENKEWCGETFYGESGRYREAFAGIQASYSYQENDEKQAPVAGFRERALQ